MNDNGNRKRKKGADYLRPIMAELVRRAYRNRNEKQNHTFTKGASVTLYIDDARELHLLVYRLGDWPGNSEWYTFIRFLPDGARPDNIPAPLYDKRGQTFGFIGKWPVMITQHPENQQ